MKVNEYNPSVVILVAGVGSRLNGRFDHPKSLIKINEETILERQINFFRQNGAREIFLVTGYKSEVIQSYLIDKKIDVKYIFNEYYEDFGNLYSLYLALASIDNDLIVVDGDIIYSDKVFKDFCNCDCVDCILAGNGDLSDIESSKVFASPDRQLRLIVDKKNPDFETIENYIFSGEAIGFLKISQTMRQKLIPICESFLLDKKYKNANWETLINSYIESEALNVCTTRDPNWVEIDFESDFEKAKSIFNNSNF